jgi:O-antigen/teichoic acid export membrane protein
MFLKNIFKYFSFNIIAKFVQALVTLGSATIFIKSDYANFAILYSILQLAMVFNIAGIPEVLTGKYLGLLKLNKSEIFLKKTRVLFMLQFLLCSILVFFYSFYFIENINFIVILLLLISALINSILKINSTIFQLEQNHNLSIKIINSSILFPHLTGLIAILIFTAPSSFIFGFFIGTLFNFIFQYKHLKFFIKLDFFINPIDILIQTYPFLIIALTGYFYGIGLTLLINLNLNLNQISNYFFIAQLVGLFLLLQGAVNQVWNPIFLNNNIYSLNTIKIHNILSGYISVLLSITAGFVIVFIDKFLLLIPGKLNQYMDLSLFILILSFGYVILGHYNRVLLYYYSNDKLKGVFLKNNFLIDFLGLFLIFIFTYYFGEIGIYISVSLLFTIKAFANINPLSSYIKFNFFEIFICFSFIISCYMLRIIIPENYLIITFLILVLLFSILFYLFQNKNIKELISFIKSQNYNVD